MPFETEALKGINLEVDKGEFWESSDILAVEKQLYCNY